MRMGRDLGKSEQEIMDKSIQGLMFNTRNFVISKEPKNMNDVKKYAKLGQSVGVTNTESVSAMEYKSQPTYQYGREKTAKKWKRGADSRVRELCLHCAGEYPHDQYTCRHRHAICYHCNGRGHIVRACPSKQGQYGSR